MPEVSIFFDGEDEQRLVTFILSLGARLVPDSRYERDSYEYITDWSAYEAVRKERMFFILFNCYDECPLQMHLIDGGYYAGRYAIRQRTGGPTIDLLTCVQYIKDGKHWVSGGGYSYFKTYKNTITGEYEQTPETLVKRYKEILKELKRGATTIQGNSGRKYVIGPHTYQQLKDGKLHLGVKGLSID